MNCYKHAHLAAKAQCMNCCVYLCENCIEQRKFGKKFIDICPKCRDMVRPLVPDMQFKKRPGSSFILKAIAFPFNMILKPIFSFFGYKTFEVNFSPVDLSELTSIPIRPVQDPKDSDYYKPKPIEPIVAIEVESRPLTFANLTNPHLQKPAFQPYIEIKTPLDEDIKKGREFKKMGELDAALDCFGLALSVDPTHPIALRECFKVYLLKGDSRSAESAINRLMHYYTSNNKRDEALILFGEVMNILPMHTFSEGSQKVLALWLKEIGDHKNAVIAYRNYAYQYPKDPSAASSLLEAGILSLNELRNRKVATKIFEILISTYPDTPECVNAKNILKEI